MLSKKRLFDALMLFAKITKVSIKAGADANGRNAKSSYIHRKGEVCGIMKLVTDWHAIGQTVS